MHEYDDTSYLGCLDWHRNLFIKRASITVQGRLEKGGEGIAAAVRLGHGSKQTTSGPEQILENSGQASLNYIW